MLPNLFSCVLSRFFAVTLPSYLAVFLTIPASN
jgi:hypothetical protein